MAVTSDTAMSGRVNAIPSHRRRCAEDRRLARPTKTVRRRIRCRRFPFISEDRITRSREVIARFGELLTTKRPQIAKIDFRHRFGPKSLPRRVRWLTTFRIGTVKVSRNFCQFVSAKPYLLKSLANCLESSAKEQSPTTAKASFARSNRATQSAASSCRDR